MMLPSHGPEPCASANSATSAHCGRWDLNPHEHTPTRSLVLPVCQFQHSRLLLFIFACRVSHSLTKVSIAQALRECKHFFVFFIFLKSQAINAKLYLRNIISSFCTTMFAFCWQICTDCPSFRFALCLFYSFYASLASSFWNSSPEVFHPNISLG